QKKDGPKVDGWHVLQSACGSERSSDRHDGAMAERSACGTPIGHSEALSLLQYTLATRRYSRVQTRPPNIHPDKLYTVQSCEQPSRRVWIVSGLARPHCRH